MHLLVDVPGRAWKVFLAWENWKKTWFFRNAHNSLTWYSNIVQTLTKETGYGFSLLPFIDEYSCLDYWNEYFFFCVSVFTLKFSQIAFFRKCVQVDSGTDWIRNGLFLGFFLGRWLFHWLYICMDWNLHDMLKLVIFMTSSLSVTFLGVTWYFRLIFKCACTL